MNTFKVCKRVRKEPLDACFYCNHAFIDQFLFLKMPLIYNKLCCHVSHQHLPGLLGSSSKISSFSSFPKHILCVLNSKKELPFSPQYTLYAVLLSPLSSWSNTEKSSAVFHIRSRIIVPPVRIERFSVAKTVEPDAPLRVCSSCESVCVRVPPPRAISCSVRGATRACVASAFVF